MRGYLLSTCIIQHIIETELRKADRTVGVNCYILANISSGNIFRQFLQAFTFADQSQTDFGTVDLSVGPF